MRVFTVAVVLLGLFSGFLGSVAAQDDEQPLPFVAGAQRQFAKTDIPLQGSGYLQFTAHVLPSAAEAEKQFPEAVARAREFLEQAGSSPMNLRPASIEDIGDQTQAFSLETTVQGTKIRVAIIIWREGPLVYTAISAGIAGDQFAELRPIIARMADQHYDESPVQIDPMTNMHTGGAWDLLPSLHDIPEGFVLADEVTLRPPQGATPTP